MSNVSDNLLKAVRHLVTSDHDHDHIIFKFTCGEKSSLGIRMFRSNSLKAFSKLLWPEKLFTEIYSNVSHGSSAELSDTWKTFIFFCQPCGFSGQFKKNCIILFTSAFNWLKPTGSGEAQFSWKGPLFVCFLVFFFLSALFRLLFVCFPFHCCTKWKVNSKLKAAESARGLF